MILYVVLGSAATAAFCWLICIDQIIQMATPSIGMERMLRFYKYIANLWSVGVFLMIFAVLLFVLLANVYLAMGVGLTVSVISVQYWKINNDW